MSFKIQINSLPALERLIGGDNELEVGIRDAIVQDFSKKYLKNVVAEEAMQKYVKQLDDSIRTEAEKTFGAWSRGKTSFQLSPEVITQINIVVNKAIDSAVREAIREELNKAIERYNNDLEIAVQNHINSNFEKLVDIEVEKRWAKVKAKL